MVSLYRLQRRNLMFDTEPKLPADFTFVAELAPSGGLVGSAEPSLTAHALVPSSASVDIYSGRMGLVSEPPMPPVAFCLLTRPHQISIVGSRIVVSGRLSALNEVPDIIGGIEHAILPLLNLAILDTAAIVRVHGRIGDTPVEWGFHRSLPSGRAVLHGDYSIELVQHLHTVTALNGQPRVYGALHYFAVGCRLARIGNSLWEFAPEIIVNFAKVLDCLFTGESEKTGSMDHARAGLARLGIPDPEIETIFIPMLVLRNQFGGGHVTLSSFDGEAMGPIYVYLEFAEDRFRSLLQVVIRKVAKEGYALQPVQAEPSLEKQLRLRRLLDAIVAGLPNWPGSAQTES